MKYKLVALIGKAGSGKDTIMKEILKQFDPYFHEIVSCTTRTPRDYEVEGVNYFYLTPEEFTDKVLNGEMLEATNFNNWFMAQAMTLYAQIASILESLILMAYVLCLKCQIWM